MDNIFFSLIMSMLTMSSMAYKNDYTGEGEVEGKIYKKLEVTFQRK